MSVCKRLPVLAVGWAVPAVLAFVLGAGLDRPASAAPAGAVTDAEVAGFAAAVDGAVSRGDAAAFSALIDWDAVIDRAGAGIEAPEAFRDAFRKAEKASIGPPKGLTAQIVEQSRLGGSYRRLRARARDGQKSALFRFTLPGRQGVNYHEFLLDRRPDGRVRATDLYIFFSGEALSKTLRRSFVLGAAEQSRGVLDRLTGADRNVVKALPKLKQMSDLSAAGKNREAVAVFDALPPALQKDKSLLLLRVRAAQQLDAKTYAEAIERFRAEHPEDECVDILSIDGFTLLKQYDQALAAIDRLDQAVGGDPYLNTFRAGIHLAADQPEKAREAARAGVKGEPAMIACYWTLLATDLRLKDYPAALEDLKSIDRRFAPTFNDMTAMPAYAGFVKSPQYEEWQTYLKARKAAQGRDAGKKD